ncbi:Preprotein translocase subunit YidC [Ignavibacterium album JCM 16511]|uniref:Membrane protein insertase YidC n=1 Tax=Ignavibacterium album (strain DSM 19864 / JCM 16511 / NBRC 101810 / Mat9-16) TaxID=945713 RepID=I0APK0_IGNAJ|nr:membrane protein insertase YidC [Ignavibacterium album]AFH50907.1 Preprotein translocase subunit YidC [Ignavibacterium album JCM 16511]
MDRQTTLAFVLIGIVLMVWLYITAPTPTDVPQQKKTPDTTATVEKEIEQQKLPVKQEKSSDSTVIKILPESSAAKESYVVIETNLARYELSTKGGNFKKVFLKKFNNWYAPHNKKDDEDFGNHVQLINYSRGGSYDFALVTEDGIALNSSELFFNYSGSYNNTLKDKDSVYLDFTLNLKNGKSIVKRYLFFSDSYEIKNEIIFNGFNDYVSNNSFDIIWNNGIRFVEHNSVDEANYSNASAYSGGEQVIIDASSVGEKISKDFRGRVDWVAVRNKYFAAVVLPDNPDNVEGAYLEGTRYAVGKDGINEVYETRLTLPFKNQIQETHKFSVYIGPVDYKQLETLGRNLIALVDFGSFFGLKFVVRPIAEYVLLPLFQFLHMFIPNYGFVIIIFSLIIKLAVYPLTKQSYQSMKKMQALQPKIAELKEKYKDDPQKLNSETMKLYSTYGINPAGGCLPILLQMPIFIALWGMFQSVIELRQQPFVWWIKDLSTPDVIYDLGFKLPLFGVQQISGLALLMGITTFFQQKMTMKDPSQKMLVYLMPIMLTILFMTFPSGLNLYYFMFNVFSIAQQYYINKVGKDVELVPVANPNKKKGFMARLMEAAEQQAKQQQKKKK